MTDMVEEERNAVMNHKQMTLDSLRWSKVDEG